MHDDHEPASLICPMCGVAADEGGACAHLMLVVDVPARRAVDGELIDAFEDAIATLERLVDQADDPLQAGEDAYAQLLTALADASDATASVHLQSWVTQTSEYRGFYLKQPDDGPAREALLQVLLNEVR